MSQPRLSVLMPVWNGEAFLREAIDSVLAQTFRDFEFVIVDDGSTDATVEIIESYKDPRIRLFRLEHGGIVLALNYGACQSRAPWICRQDADDISLPERFEKQWSAIERTPNATLCHTDFELFGPGAHTQGIARLPRTEALLAVRMCYQCAVLHPTVMMRKSAVEAAGGYRPEERHAEDYSLFGRLLELGRVVAVPEKLVRYRFHERSASRQNSSVQSALAAKISGDHCRRFFGLDDARGARVHRLLRKAARERTIHEWVWFIVACVPRLRWQSIELYAWLVVQIVKVATGLPRPSETRHAT